MTDKDAEDRLEPEPIKQVLMYEFDPIPEWSRDMKLRHVIPKKVVYKRKFNTTNNTVGEGITTRDRVDIYNRHDIMDRHDMTYIWIQDNQSLLFRRR